jgi:hypothetical protein
MGARWDVRWQQAVNNVKIEVKYTADFTCNEIIQLMIQDEQSLTALHNNL